MTNKTFKALSVLLQYPSEDLIAALPEIIVVLGTEPRLSSAVKEKFVLLMDYLNHHELLRLQEEYVELFDRTRILSLHIFEHVHGESRARGQAMVDLQEHYQSYGFEVAPSELPDFLPLILEFFAEIEFAEAQALLQQFITVIVSIEAQLKVRQSPYIAMFDALIELSGATVEIPLIREALKQSPEALDKEWEESVVKFGGQDTASGCGSCDTNKGCH